MIEQQIRPWEVLDQGVLSLLAVVQREAFVPPAYRALAFIDTEVPLPEGQCMLAPRVEARLLQELHLGGHEQVLEIGAGSGYMAALMAHQSQHVTTLEIRPALAAMARANLQRAGIGNAQVIEADGATARAAPGPFDAIVLSGSVAEVPATLLAQLKVGGPAGGHRRPGAGDARRAHQPHRRAAVQARPALRHRGAAPRRVRRADAIPFLMPRLHSASAITQSVAKPWAGVAPRSTRTLPHLARKVAHHDPSPASRAGPGLVRCTAGTRAEPARTLRGRAGL